MKLAKFFLYISVICIHNISWAQTTIQFGNLYYYISGTSASVAEHPNSNSWESYTEQEYVIPETITYNNVLYTVNEISAYAFSQFVSGRGPGQGSTTSKIIMPNTIIRIGRNAFANCKNLTSMIIPQSVNKFTSIELYDKLYQAFYGCDLLRELIYLPKSAPAGWTATSKTYVPDKKSYSSPYYSINDAHVIEMITFNQNEFEYSGQAPTTTWTNNVEGYTASLSLSALSGEVGAHEEWIPVSFTKGDESFTASVVYRYTVKPAKVTVKVTNTYREYGEENPQFNISYSGFVNGENESVITSTPTISTTATKTSYVGEYPITVSGGSAKNYVFVYEPGVLTITKAPLSAKVNDATRVYGSQNPAFTIEYYGLKNDETAPAWSKTPTFQTEATQSSSVGKYEVTAVNGVPVNYDLGEITAGTLSVTPAPLTIKANDATRQYYSDEPSFGYTCNGFVNGENENVLSPAPTLATSANKSSSVGTYPIKASGASNSNYSISYVDGTLTITPRTLYASVGNYERLYNEDNPAFEVKYDGFVGNENENVLITKATASTTATKTSDVGSYPINVTGGSADNYKFSYTSGTLTINKAEQTISWEQDLTGLMVGDQVELKATVSSGLPVSYTMDNTSAAEIYSSGNKSYLDCKAGGQFLIRAVQNGNKNYYSSPRASNTVSIIGTNPTSDPTLTIKQADNGSVKVQVSKGSVYTFTMAPSNGWRVHSVTFNNSDVTSQLTSNGSFTTPAITSNSTLSVVYEQGSSSVNSTRSSDVKIMATSEGIKVVDANMGDMVRVYTTDGLLQQSIKVDSQTFDIPLTKHDVYIIKVGGKTVKLGY